MEKKLHGLLAMNFGSDNKSSQKILLDVRVTPRVGKGQFIAESVRLLNFKLEDFHFPTTTTKQLNLRIQT